MTPLAALLGIPLIAAFILAFIPSGRWAARINIATSFATFAASLLLLIDPPAPGIFTFADDLSLYLMVLTAFIGFTTSWVGADYIAHELASGRLPAPYVRFYHPLYQVLSFALQLALASNNIGVMWVAVEAATLITVLMISLYRTRESLEAAWKHFILGSVGIALALFGTILIYLAAQPVIGADLPALAWTALMTSAPELDPNILNLAFVFLLVGYGTKIGLVPLHTWLPDAHAEGPAPISAVLSGLLLNIGMYCVLRFKMLLDANGRAMESGPLLVIMGLASVVLAAFMLYRRRDLRRLFAYSSIEHMGVAAFAFGLGGPIANFAGLLHLALHSRTKSAIFFAIGHITQAKGTQKIAEIGGLTQSHPALGWALVIGGVALAGLPPLGLFTSEFLLVTSAMATAPVLVLILAFGLLLSLGALIWRLQPVAFGEMRGNSQPISGSLAPIFMHFFLVLAAGLFLPPPVAAWLQDIAAMLGQ